MGGLLARFVFGTHQLAPAGTSRHLDLDLAIGRIDRSPVRPWKLDALLPVDSHTDRRCVRHKQVGQFVRILFLADQRHLDAGAVLFHHDRVVVHL